MAKKKKRAAKSTHGAKSPPKPGADPRCLCGSPFPESDRYCSTCRRDVGAPNVRSAGSPVERSCLGRRFRKAKERAKSKKLTKAFANCADVLSRSGVVVAMPASVARQLTEDPRQIYVNYETLVGAGTRRAAPNENDRHRFAISGLFFGSYRTKIIYGILSLNDEGLPTYGEVYCRLRDVTIQDRTSFLEENTYVFAKRHDLKPDSPIPEGYSAAWDNRHELGMAKIVERLTSDQGLSSWQKLLVQSDGKNRQNDDFIEAHIFEEFDIAAVEKMTLAAERRLSRKDKLDARLAIECFQKRA